MPDVNAAPSAAGPRRSWGAGPSDAAHIVAALTSSAEQELTIAERLTGKARQAFALGAGLFVVAQTMVGSFDQTHLSTRERHWIIGLAVLAAALLGAACLCTLKADSPVTSGDLPLAKLERDLNAAYTGDTDVLGKLGGYYLGVVRSRRAANARRLTWYKRARGAVVLALVATLGQLIFALIARAT